MLLISLETHTQDMYTLLLFYVTNNYTTATQCFGYTYIV